jgi:hypothetical protein
VASCAKAGAAMIAVIAKMLAVFCQIFIQNSFIY